MATVYVGGASIDERGKAKGGEAGNQTGRELRKQAWYLHSKGWRVFRAKNAVRAKEIAEDMRKAIANKKIGYDQGQRNTLYNLASKVGFDCSKVKTACETDCSALVRVCCAYAGIMLPNFTTPTEPAKLLDSGEFVELTGDKYTKQSQYLRTGDILVTKTQGHTVVVLNDGSKAETNANYNDKSNDSSKNSANGGDTVNITLNVLRKGAKGAEVRTLQTLLKGFGYNLGSYGVDGDFGSATEAAVKEYQRDQHIVIDGIVGADTWYKLLKG